MDTDNINDNGLHETAEALKANFRLNMLMCRIAAAIRINLKKDNMDPSQVISTSDSLDLGNPTYVCNTAMLAGAAMWAAYSTVPEAMDISRRGSRTCNLPRLMDKLYERSLRKGTCRYTPNKLHVIGKVNDKLQSLFDSVRADIAMTVVGTVVDAYTQALTNDGFGLSHDKRTGTVTFTAGKNFHKNSRMGLLADAMAYILFKACREGDGADTASDFDIYEHAYYSAVACTSVWLSSVVKCKVDEDFFDAVVREAACEFGRFVTPRQTCPARRDEPVAKTPGPVDIPEPGEEEYVAQHVEYDKSSNAMPPTNHKHVVPVSKKKVRKAAPAKEVMECIDRNYLILDQKDWLAIIKVAAENLSRLEAERAKHRL